MELALIALMLVLALGSFWRATFGFALVAAVQMVFRVIGLMMLGESGRASYASAWLFMVSLVAFVIGYFAAEFVIRARGASPPVRLKAFPSAAVWAVVLVAGVLGIYHLIAGGIPIFSSSIETERFDFSSSGLFGIPGRMYLFGVPIAWILASVNAQALQMRWRDYGPWRWATAAFVITTFLSGFKGDAFSLVLTLVALYIVISGSRITVGTMVRKFWWTGVVAVGYFVVVASLYPTYSSSGYSVAEQLFRRLTTVPAVPVYYAMEGLATEPGAVPIIADFGYFLAKYSGNEIAGSFSFERAVSAAMIGVDPSSQAWTTPVTVSGYAELFASFGGIVAVVAIFFTGILLSWIESGPHRTSIGLVLRAVTGMALVSWLARGGLAYHVVNYFAVIAFLAAIGFAATLFTTIRPSLPSSGMSRYRPMRSRR
ncbi:hypothetical protein GCM10009808_00190 [Microbacterium sediminicola]|uniref:Oligosaccharide repeat unit polymerase n=1 Tax=Microbacterium sediminicola TaxID=415210 RepID=A0ABN2HGS3_9MICO